MLTESRDRTIEPNQSLMGKEIAVLQHFFTIKKKIKNKEVLIHDFSEKKIQCFQKKARWIFINLHQQNHPSGYKSLRSIWVPVSPWIKIIWFSFWLEKNILTLMKLSWQKFNRSKHIPAKKMLLCSQFSTGWLLCQTLPTTPPSENQTEEPTPQVSNPTPVSALLKDPCKSLNSGLLMEEQDGCAAAMCWWRMGEPGLSPGSRKDNTPSLPSHHCNSALGRKAANDIYQGQ